MKFKLNSVSSKLKPKRRTVLLVTSGLFVAVVLLGSVALYQKHQENVSQAHAATLATEAKADQARTARENATKAQLAQSDIYRHQLCDLILAAEKAPATKGKITRPAIPCTF